MAEEGAIHNKDEGLQKLFFGGLARETTEESFRKYVEEYGEVSDLVIIRDNSGVSKGFGFVSFANGEGADACLEKCKNKALIDGKEVEVKRAVPREMANNLEEKEKTTRVFIGGLSKVTTEESIRQFFSSTYPESSLENVELIMTKDPMPGEQPVHRGFGFLTFSDIHFVDKICIVKYHEIDGKKTEVKWASAKGPGRGRGRGGYNQGGYGHHYGPPPPYGGYGPPPPYGGYGPPPGHYGGYGPPPYGYGGYDGGRGSRGGRYKPY